ncbi:hypothetical protein OHV10_19070 [Vibrio splendidus]|uniref:hypothetical protein n=1 Tax=Vibrio splendidus TaxID=29497 RepID=UPI00223687BB|nr:hypothetical protein [Vibrio splendidus]MCW4446345.1 hypothetical protein [Vibrio splendidus]
MKRLIKPQALYLGIVLAVIAIILDFMLSPSVDVHDDEPQVIDSLYTSVEADTSKINNEQKALLSHFSSINPLKIKKAEEDETTVEEVKPVEPKLQEGEQQLLSLAIRLSAVFEQNQSMFAVVQMRDLTSGELSREVLRQGGGLSGFTVTHIGRDRVTLNSNSNETLELILFKQK